MKMLKQFLVILIVSCMGEFLRYLIPLPIPASIYGLILMFAALSLHIIPLEKVKDAGLFLIDIMPVMFIPSAAGLLVSGKALQKMWLPLLIIIPVNTILVMGVTGVVAQFIQRKQRGRKANESSAVQMTNLADISENNSAQKGGGR